MTGISAAVFLGALISIAVIALTILLGVWTYRDAQSKNMNGLLWTLVVILVPSCIGLIIYLIVRMDNNKVTCSKCNAYVNAKSKFCSNCGEELVPVVEISEEDAAFKQSQRNIMIGFFSTLGGIVILSILMVAFLIIGGIKIAGNIAENAMDWAFKADTVKVLEESLGNLDVLFDEDEVHLTIQGNQVTLKDKEGNELLFIDGDKNSVDIDLKDIRALLDRYGIEYNENMSEDEIEEEIRKEIKKALDEVIDKQNEAEETDK